MKYKKVKLFAILLFGLGLSGLYAQTTLYIKDNSGIQTPYAFSSIRKLTFPAGNIMVTTTNGNTATYALSNTSNINLTSLTTDVSLISSKRNNKFLLYPNPVMDQLEISYETITSEAMTLYIIDLQGKVLYHQMIKIESGTNNEVINVSNLTRGLYVCRLQSDDKNETVKFLKN